ncbi:hypothetical protein JKA74_04460 [Marivirga sp. S37H4]|uniref:Uncharacterized protein n=1 Tax=Marivirga aurantiaca TaxID=2802615 RepID=A0A935C6B7_9BACT|nr:hypothetical protein [Marivirga aurantiaca]MBK6264279.1 hypothetical protein [Marivirga aurantiaca]
METKYKKGEVVYERTRPSQKLYISRCVSGIYYCKVEEDTKRKELVYFERDILPYMEKSN